MHKTPSKSRHQPLSPLAADIEAEFGMLRRPAPREGGPLAPAQANALRVAIEQAAQAMPKALRASFVRNAAERLRAHFGRDHDDIGEGQFHEAVAVIGQYIAEARRRLDRIAVEMPRTEHRRWRVTFFDLGDSHRDPPE